MKIVNIKKSAMWSQKKLCRSEDERERNPEDLQLVINVSIKVEAGE